MKYNANASQIIETHLRVVKVLDGDSLIVASMFGKSEKEIRLYGLDAPENKYNRKLRDSEKKSRIAGELLVEMGKLSTEIVLKLAPPGASVTLITEKSNQYDFYGRQLGYIILPSGECLNEILLKEGYAKAESEYYCSKLEEYQKLNFDAMKSKVGLYALVSSF